MRIALVDDSTIDRIKITNVLRKWANERSIDLILIDFSSGDRFLDVIDSDPGFCDACFLDISMHGKNGIEVAQILCEKHSDLVKVFYSSIVEYIYKGYMVNAARYIVKTAPDCEEQLYECMGYLLSLYNEKHSSKVEIITKYGSREFISYNDVQYITSSKNYSELHFSDNVITQRRSLVSLENDLPPQFVRCSRTVIVNVRHIVKLARNSITVTHGDVLPIGEKFSSSFMEKYIELQ